MTPKAKIRIAIVVLLAITPLIFLIGTGAYHLWHTGWTFIAWWPMALCLLCAYGLGWYWTRRGNTSVLPAQVIQPLPYWTERDRTAWAKVEERVKLVLRVRAEDALDAAKYTKDAQEMALDVARVYLPGTNNPYGHLTLPEVLACAELVAGDLGVLVEKYLPGSHVVRIQDFGKVQQATDWYKRARGVYWLANSFVNPLKTAMQVAATKFGLTTPWQMLQENVLLWFYTSFLRELGRYLVELNSGRLKVGVKRYRELMAANQEPPTDEPVGTIRVAIVGPAGSGKQSLVDALTAASDIPGTLSFSKTDGYGVNGPGEMELVQATEAARGADIVLLTIPARSAARAAEIALLDTLKANFAQTPQYRVPPVVAVLTNVDHLTPASEWNPPYDWAKGERVKEKTAREAVAAVREVFADRITAAVPVCVAKGKESGVNPELVLTLAGLLDEARAVKLLKAFHAESAGDAARKVVGQVVNAGREAARVIWEQLKK